MVHNLQYGPRTRLANNNNNNNNNNISALGALKQSLSVLTLMQIIRGIKNSAHMASWIQLSHNRWVRFITKTSHCYFTVIIYSYLVFTLSLLFRCPLSAGGLPSARHVNKVHLFIEPLKNVLCFSCSLSDTS